MYLQLKFELIWLILKQQWRIKISSPLFSIFSLVGILAQWFLMRRLKCEMLTDGRQTTDEM